METIYYILIFYFFEQKYSRVKEFVVMPEYFLGIISKTRINFY